MQRTINTRNGGMIPVGEGNVTFENGRWNYSGEMELPPLFDVIEEVIR